jgi:hypothetical protein
VDYERIVRPLIYTEVCCAVLSLKGGPDYQMFFFLTLYGGIIGFGLGLANMRLRKGDGSSSRGRKIPGLLCVLAPAFWFVGLMWHVLMVDSCIASDQYCMDLRYRDFFVTSTFYIFLPIWYLARHRDALRTLVSGR